FTYDAGKNILTSPLLYDPTTQIDRSATTTVGSGAYNAGLPVGSPPNGVVKASDITVMPTGYAPAPGSDMVFTKIHSFDLSNGAGVDGKAGLAAQPGTPASKGMVVSNSSSGSPAVDFPARSFFDIFIEVDVPGLGSPMNNVAPLLVDNPGITA